MSQILIYQKIILLKTNLNKEMSEKINHLKKRTKRVIFNRKTSTHGLEIEKYMLGNSCCTFEAKMSGE